MLRKNIKLLGDLLISNMEKNAREPVFASTALRTLSLTAIPWGCGGSKNSRTVVAELVKAARLVPVTVELTGDPKHKPHRQLSLRRYWPSDTYYKLP